MSFIIWCIKFGVYTITKKKFKSVAKQMRKLQLDSESCGVNFSKATLAEQPDEELLSSCLPFWPFRCNVKTLINKTTGGIVSKISLILRKWLWDFWRGNIQKTIRRSGKEDHLSYPSSHDFNRKCSEITHFMKKDFFCSGFKSNHSNYSR